MEEKVDCADKEGNTTTEITEMESCNKGSIFAMKWIMGCVKAWIFTKGFYKKKKSKNFQGLWKNLNFFKPKV